RRAPESQRAAIKKDPRCGSSWCRLLFQFGGLGWERQGESWGGGNEGNGWAPGRPRRSPIPDGLYAGTDKDLVFLVHSCCARNSHRHIRIREGMRPFLVATALIRKNAILSKFFEELWLHVFQETLCLVDSSFQ